MHDDRREYLRQVVAYWSERVRAKPRIVRVQCMTRKWGSCSTSGIITLADDLPDQDSAFQAFVVAHELLHLRVRNHGKVFKALMSAHVPGWQKHDVRRLGCNNPLHGVSKANYLNGQGGSND